MKSALSILACLVPLCAQEQEIRARLARMFPADQPGCVVAVWHGGKVQGPWVRGRADLDEGVALRADSRFYLASVSKQFTAACVHLLLEAGKARLDTQVQLGGRGFALGDLLGHSSGLRDHLSLLQLAGVDLDQGVSPARVDALVRAQRGLNHAPGKEFVYTNTGYHALAAWVAEQAGSSLARFADSRIFTPLDMKATSYRDDPDAAARAEVVGHVREQGGYRVQRSKYALVGPGGVVSTAADLLTWVQALQAGKLGGEAFSARLCKPSAALGNPEYGRYAAGWFVGRHRGRELHWHPGGALGFSTCLLWCRAEQFAVVVLCNREGGEARRLAFGITDLYLAPVAAAEASAEPEAGVPPPEGQLCFRHPQHGGAILVWRRGTKAKVACANWDVAMRVDGPILHSERALLPVRAQIKQRGEGRELHLRLGQGAALVCPEIPRRPVREADVEGLLGAWSIPEVPGARLEIRLAGRLLRIDGLPEGIDGRLMAVHPDLWMGDAGLSLELRRGAAGEIEELRFSTPRARGLLLQR